jgi:hypothetical protein
MKKIPQLERKIASKGSKITRIVLKVSLKKVKFQFTFITSYIHSNESIGFNLRSNKKS